jgi:hypothetical protein
MLDKVSSYHLIYELDFDGKVGLIPELKSLEPMDKDEIIKELSRRSGWEYSNDVLHWVEWFLTEAPDATAEQKVSIGFLKRITTAERKALKKLGIDKFEE